MAETETEAAVKDSPPEQTGGLDVVMFPDGRLKPPYDTKYPLAHAYAVWDVDKNTASGKLPEDLSPKPEAPYLRNILATTDGVSDYSHQWWEAYFAGKCTEQQAIHETLAEMAALKHLSKTMGTMPAINVRKSGDVVQEAFKWTGPLLRHNKSKDYPQGFATTNGMPQIMKRGADLWNRLYAMVNPDAYPLNR